MAASSTTPPTSQSSPFTVHTIQLKALGTEFEIGYGEAGPESGPVVIGIHGAPCTHNAFRGLVPPFVSAGYRVIVPNLPGNGVSQVDKDNVYDYTTQNKAEIVKALIQALQIDRVAMIFAHSMGCHVAAHVASSLPREGAVQSLGLICTPGAHPHKLITPLFFHKVLTNFLYWILHTPIVGGIIARILSPVFAASGFKGRNSMAEILGYYEAVHMDFPQFGQDCEHLADQRCPVILLSSSNDKIVQYSLTEEIMSILGIRVEDIKWYHKGQHHTEVAIRDCDISRAVVFDDGSHFILNKYPKQLVHEIDQFLQTVL